MVKQRTSGKKFIFSILVLLMGVFLFARRTIFAETLSVGDQQQVGQAGDLGTANDFNGDVQIGLQNLTINSTAHAQRKELRNQDYISAWDEFGTNVLIDGTTTPAEVVRGINQDLIQAVQIETNYDQQETKYLEDIKIAPEEIQTMEESGGSDIPPGEFIDPSPSAEANPDASMSAGENQEQNNAEESTSTENTSALQTTSTAETGTSTSEVSTSSDETIFDAILQGEQMLASPSPEPAPESTPPPAEPPQVESPPPEPPPAE